MNKAVTLIELLIVISVMMVLTGLAIFNLSGATSNANIDGARTTVVVALRQAQGNSRAMLDNQRWGVHFETNKITIFTDAGSGFDQSDNKNQVRLLADGITCEISQPGGGNDILFEKRTGEVIAEGLVTLSDGQANKTISINSEGGIGYQ